MLIKEAGKGRLSTPRLRRPRPRKGKQEVRFLQTCVSLRVSCSGHARGQPIGDLSQSTEDARRQENGWPVGPKDGVVEESWGGGPLSPPGRCPLLGEATPLRGTHFGAIHFAARTSGLPTSRLALAIGTSTLALAGRHLQARRKCKAGQPRTGRQTPCGPKERTAFGANQARRPDDMRRRPRRSPREGQRHSNRDGSRR